MAFNNGDTFKHVFKVLFVCSDNLCRSPVAQAVFEKKSALAQLDSFFCSDSAGMSVIESGKTPDSRRIHGKTVGEREAVLEYMRNRCRA